MAEAVAEDSSGEEVPGTDVMNDMANQASLLFFTWSMPAKPALTDQFSHDCTHTHSHTHTHTPLTPFKETLVSLRRSLFGLVPPPFSLHLSLSRAFIFCHLLLFSICLIFFLLSISIFLSCLYFDSLYSQSLIPLFKDR